jgi:uncharacterized membrane protein
MLSIGLTRRVLAGHPRTFIALGVGVAAWMVIAGAYPGWAAQTRAIAGWDVGAFAFLAMAIHLFAVRLPKQMAADAEAQEEGQWTIFWVMLLGTIFSFAALSGEFSGLKDLPRVERGLHVALVAATLLLSWLLAHLVFTFRYAHEWYDLDEQGRTKGGLAFPSDDLPDYFDFLYFSVVIGMTFQVSDVQITSRRLRRLVLMHGLLSFLFNTVIVALTVNIAAGLL